MFFIKIADGKIWTQVYVEFESLLSYEAHEELVEMIAF